MSQRARLKHLTEPQLPQAIAMISRAFYNDPLSVYIYQDAGERSHRLPLMFGIALRYALRYGEVVTTLEGTGAACWLPPESVTVNILRLVRIGALQASLKMGMLGLRRLNRAENDMKRMHKRCIMGLHWYLWVLGVEPENQGQGIGGMLLRAGLERVDASSLPCYLETMNPANVPLYQKFGFAIAGDGSIPGSSVPIWGMVRPAHARL